MRAVREKGGEPGQVDEREFGCVDRKRCARCPECRKRRPSHERREIAEHDPVEWPEADAVSDEDGACNENEEGERRPAPLGREVAAVDDRRASDRGEDDRCGNDSPHIVMFYVVANTPRLYEGRVSTTRSPGTRAKSAMLSVTTPKPCITAVAAIQRSCAPRTSPRPASSAHISA